MSRILTPRPLTAAAFAPYGDVLEASGDCRVINKGWCNRYHDRARLDFGPEGTGGISVFQGKCRSFPYDFRMIERHPLGSQAFIPMSEEPFLVIVSTGPEARPEAFVTAPGQGINLHRGTWHGVLTPLTGAGLFAVVDRVTDGPNIEEHYFDEDWTVLAPSAAAAG